MVSVGGFFATLAMKADQATFDKSKKELGEIEKSTKKTGQEFEAFVGNAIKGLLALGAGALGAAGSVSMIQGKMTITAAKAGMTYTELNKVSTAFKLLGLDASTTTTKMAEVNAALNDYKMGRNPESYTKLATDLSILGINPQTFEKMTPTERIKTVSDTAQAQTDSGKRIAYRNAADNLLGLGDMLLVFDEAGSKYKTFNQLQAGAALKPMATGANAIANQQSITGLTTSMAGLWDSFGESMMKGFKPIIDALTNLIDKNGPAITAFFDNVGTVLASMVEKTGPIFKIAADVIGQKTASLATMDEYSKNVDTKNKQLTPIVNRLTKSGMADPGNMLDTAFKGSEVLRTKYITNQVMKLQDPKYAENLAKGIGAKDIEKTLADIKNNPLLEKLYMKDGSIKGSVSTPGIGLGAITVNLSVQESKEFVGAMRKNPELAWENIYSLYTKQSLEQPGTQ
jgi:hypothetical protein